MKTNCETCGANVEVVGSTTKYYKNLDREEIERLELEIATLKGVVRYLEEFVDFCDCGNPKDDCICGV